MTAQLNSISSLWIPAANLENITEGEAALHGETIDSGLRVKLKETRKEYVIRVKLPGLTKHDFELALKDDVLSLETGKWRGKSYEAFKQNFRLGKNLVQEAIKTKFRNGVLTIVVGKLKQAYY